jgi:hypothetical protein
MQFIDESSSSRPVPVPTFSDRTAEVVEPGRFKNFTKEPLETNEPKITNDATQEENKREENKEEDLDNEDFNHDEIEEEESRINLEDVIFRLYYLNKI